MRRSRQIESDLVSNNNGWWSRFLGGKDVAGVTVNESTVRTSSTYWVCSKAISEDVAKLPFHLYQRDAGGGRSRATQHPASSLLLKSPNPEMSAFTFIEKMQDWALNWGNGMAEIERLRNGKPYRIWPMKPWRTRLKREYQTRELVYEYTNPSGQSRLISPDDVFHVRGPTDDGIVGYNVVTLAQVSVGMALAADQFAASFYANRAIPAAILKHPAKFKDPKAAERLREQFEKLYGGKENQGRIAVLEEAMEFEQLTMPLDNAQFLEQRQFSVAEVCRWFRFPPHKAGDLSRATFSNIEHQGLEYVTDTLGAWLERWRQEAALKLLTEKEREELYFEHLTDALLRGDIKSRHEAYQKGLDAGWINPDEVRQRENMNPLPDGQGTVYRVPLNMQTPKQLMEGKAKPAPTVLKDPPKPLPAHDGDEAKSARAIVEAFAPALDQAFRNLLRIEAEKLRRAAARSKTMEHIDEFYRSHADAVRSHVFPAIETLAATLRVHPDHAARDVDAAAVVAAIAARHCEISSRQAAAGMPDPEAVASGWTKDEAATRTKTAIDEIVALIDTPKG